MGDGHRIGMVPQGHHEGLRVRAHAIGKTRGALSRVRRISDQVLRKVGYDRNQQILIGPNMIVKRALAETCALPKIVDPDIAVTPFGKQSAGSLHDLPLGPGCARHVLRVFCASYRHCPDRLMENQSELSAIRGSR